MASTATSSSSSDSEPTKGTKRKLVQKKHESEPDSDESSDSSDSENEEDEAQPAEDDAPVLSHAEQRRAKRKELKAEKAKATGTDASKDKSAKVKNTAELPPSKVPKRQNSVWVGNLAFKTTAEALRSFFDGVGEITRLHMPMKLASAGPGGRGTVKENRGFAYVDFATPDAKTLAITLTENPLEGRRLLIKDGDDFAGRPSTSTQPEAADGTAAADKKPTGHSKTAQKILATQKQPPGPTLFMGNLGFETTEQSIREMLESHREKKVEAADEPPAEVEEQTQPTDEKKKRDTSWIRKIRLGTFEDTGKCKGWAFVDFKTTEQATAALTNQRNHFLDGRKLVVEYASPEAVRRGGAGSRGDKGKGRPPAAGGHDETGDKPRRERVRPVRKRAGEDGEEEQPTKRRRKDDDGEAEAEGTRVHRTRERREGNARAPRVRAKPGAALANAKREDVSIVPSQGTKIVF